MGECRVIIGLEAEATGVDQSELILVLMSVQRNRNWVRMLYLLHQVQYPVL